MNFKIYNSKLPGVLIIIFMIYTLTTVKGTWAGDETDFASGKHKGSLSFSDKSSGLDKTAAAPINIEAAIEIALQHNLNIAAKRKMVEKAEAQVTKASLLFPSNPKIETEIGSRNSKEDRHTDYNVSLSQEVEIFGQRGKRIKVAKKNLESIKFQIKDAERKIIARVKSAFYETLTIQEVIELKHKVVKIFKRLHEATQERYKVGAISALELNSIQIQYGLAKQELNKVRNDFQKSILDFKFVLGLKEENALNITGSLSYEPTILNKDDLMTAAFKNRPDLKATEFEIERANSEIRLRKAEIIPNPELSGFFNREEGSDDIVGGKMSISIPIWDRKQSELKAARSEKDIAKINIENKYLQIEKEIDSAYRSFKSSVKSITIFDNEIIPQVDENLELNEISYSEGKINFIEFLTVQNSLIETKTIHLNALLDYNKAIIDLETVSGLKISRQ